MGAPETLPPERLPSRSRRRLGSRSVLALVVLLAGAASGCAALGRSATRDLAQHLSHAVLDHDDVATVRDAAPSFLLLLDALVSADPTNRELLLTGSMLYARYASAFVPEKDRATRLAERARRYAERAVCVDARPLCGETSEPFDAFVAALGRTTVDDVPALYGLGASWATWISLRSGDWSALADLPKVEALMARVVELDDRFDDGGAHLYLGVLKTQRPAELGGEPERGRTHFERALALSSDRNLMIKVLLARHYARLVFDRELHDRLLNEVVTADAHSDGLTLTNTLAQHEARALLGSADQYF